METSSEQVFACYSKACAPPPVGTGGSSGGGAGGTERASWRAALRNSEQAVFDRGRSSFVTSHKTKGKTTEWSVYRGQAGKPGTMRKAGGGRSRNPEKALEHLLDVVLDGAYR